MWTNSLFLRAFLGRSFRLWIVSRVAISAVFLLGRVNPLSLSISAMIDVIVLVIAICLFDIRRSGERALIGNLGVQPAALVAILAVPPIIGEGALRLLSSLHL